MLKSQWSSCGASFCDFDIWHELENFGVRALQTFLLIFPWKSHYASHPSLSWVGEKFYYPGEKWQIHTNPSEPPPSLLQSHWFPWNAKIRFRSILMSGLDQESFPGLCRLLFKRGIHPGLHFQLYWCDFRAESDLYRSYMATRKRGIGQIVHKAPVDLRASSSSLGSFSFYP